MNNTITLKAMESGVTAFGPPPASTYRFVILHQAEKLKLTLEDRTTKKQWSSGFLDEKEYVTSTNRIPNASLIEYIKVFKDTLEYLVRDEKTALKNDVMTQATNLVNSSKIRRKLTLLGDDAVQLELAVKIRILQSAWTAKYVFYLKPVALERIDILEAKFRDLQDELEMTKNTLDKEKQKRVDVMEALSEVKNKLVAAETELASMNKAQAVVRLNAASDNVAELNDKGQVLWSTVIGIGFASTKNGYGVRFLVAGWYVVNATIYLAPQTNGTDIKIEVNGKYLRSQPAPCTLKQNASVTFAITTYFRKDNELSIVISKSPKNVGANLDAFRVGK
ncbi:hypothetical protein CCR75_007331 [Bremia lactucae]|uniref:Uncharacterized protein n=1 Tax=Bremia lactucae TaxID=4779 RepID=A0A976FIB4_BRELC|nr:hypothetical protein CCR75_007331 [Bremia lactucae]